MAVHETIDDGIATLTMDNPPVSALNTVDAYFIAEKIRSYNEQAESVKVVLIRSSQNGFCAGVDIKEMQSLPGNEGILKANHSCFEMFDAIHSSKSPVIVSVNGHCLGSGVGIAGSADVVVASEEATFGLPEVDNGALGAASHLMRLVPPQKARWMLYTCESVTAQELFTYGSVLKVVKAEQLEETSFEIAKRIADKDSTLIRAAKASLDGIEETDLSRRYRFEQGYTFEMNLMGIGDQARDAFLDK
ncbi:MAG: enoyl-CoA hydratase family protein [Actinomycetota bacterium]|nr:enoyl-CoA hydratase family protein [Actinomycetota bacterium]|tara:strand:+ start:2944 stop:3684 length:741 start_codon:yes stop_codon:yes gene_type:complete